MSPLKRSLAKFFRLKVSSEANPMLGASLAASNSPNTRLARASTLVVKKKKPLVLQELRLHEKIE